MLENNIDLSVLDKYKNLDDENNMNEKLTINIDWTDIEGTGKKAQNILFDKLKKDIFANL